MSKCILITGGFGYLGGRISNYLGSKGYEVIITTQRSKEMWPDWSESFKIIKIESDYSLANIAEPIDTVLHLAGMNEIDCIKDVAKTIDVNIKGTVDLLKYAVRKNINRFIYFSTAHIYRSPLEGNISEDIVPRPTHPYAITKKTAEDFVLSYASKFAMVGVVLRLSNIIGAPKDPLVNQWTLVCNDLCKQAISNKKMILHGSGMTARDFLAIGELTNIIKHFIEIDKERIDDEVFNVGSGKTITVFDLAQKISIKCKYLYGFTPEIVLSKNKKPEITPTFSYNINKLISLGVPVSENLDNEIERTLSFVVEQTLADACNV